MVKILITFYRFLATKKMWFLVFLVLVVFSAILGSIQPIFYKYFVEAIPRLDSIELYKILAGFIGIRFLSLIFSSLAFTAGDLVLMHGAANARREIFKHVQDLDFAFHTEKSTGSLISAFKRGDSAFFNLYHSIHFRIIEIIVSFLTMLYFFIELDISISLITILSFVMVLLASKFIISYNVKTRTQYNEEEDNISGIIVDNMINFETVKLFSKEAWERKRLKRAFDRWKKALWKYGMSFRVFDVTLGTIINFSVMGTLLIALQYTLSSKMSLGDFVLIVGFVSSFYPRVFDLVWGFRDIAKSYADIDRYFGLLDFDIQVKDPENPVKKKSVDGEIAFNNVRFSYKGGKKNALRNVDFRIRQGQSVALVGRSGSGKTTTIKLLMRFYDVDSGSITIDGIDLRDFSKTGLRSFMGVVPQEPILFNNTVAYNIGYGNPGTGLEEIRAAAKLANIDDFIESLPKKYETSVGERGIKLSGGQKQRLAIARMILSDPEIVIFDEATSHLDSESENLIQDAFWKAAKNKTTIIIAHRLSTVVRADKIIVMDKGKITEVGSHRELLAKDKSLYKHFWDLQAKA